MPLLAPARSPAGIRVGLATAGALGVSAIAAPAAAEVAVVASIKPVHSLVAGVTAGVGTPALIVAGGGSPHAYTMRPSEARALDGADVVFWIGPALETFLAGPIATLAGGARIVALQDAPDVRLLPLRDDAAFEAHDHGGEDGHDHGDEAGHDHDHADEHGRAEGHDHADGHDHDHDHADGHDHDHGHADGHDHDHGHDHGGEGGIDAHLWLDPVNARAWVSAIVDAMSEADPANASVYEENGAALADRLNALTSEMDATLEPVRDRPFLVFHDAYQYLETRFDLAVAGAVTLNPAAPPGARRVAEIRERAQETGARCLFREPQFEPRITEVVAEGADVTIGVLDPLGADLEPGPDLYFELMRRNADALVDCLAETP